MFTNSAQNGPIYCGQGRVKEFDDGNQVVNLNINLDVLNSNFEMHGITGSNGQKYINLKVFHKTAADTYGNTLSVAVDVYKSKK